MMLGMAHHSTERITEDLKVAIFKSGASQQIVASRTGLSKSAVARRLSGEVDITVRELEDLAAAVDLAVDIKLVPALAERGDAA
jgi:transcriptional regulator with XRE-family HTH domain